MEYFKKLTQQDIIHLISSTQGVLYLCMPSLHKEMTDSIIQLNALNTKVNISLLIDFDAQTFRQGYGDFQSIETLLKNEIEIKNLNDNRISFIISDEVGYYLFVESRTLIPADKETINAIKIDPVSMVRLKKFFFSSNSIVDYQDELTNAIIEESKQLKNAESILGQQIALVEELREAEVKNIKEDLKRNPPLNPDYRRIVEFYSNKFQYVKLKFEGANLKSRKIEIPTNILPIADTHLRKMMETKLNLFDPENKEAFKELFELNDQIKSIRENYLKKVKSREESLLEKTKKMEFEGELKEFRDQIKTVQEMVVNNIDLLIIQTKKSLAMMLKDFFVANPKAMSDKKHNLEQLDISTIEVYAVDKSQNVVQNIIWPNGQKLVDGIKLDIQFSDITIEDLKNERFIKELKDIGLINDVDDDQLAVFGKGLEII